MAGWLPQDGGTCTHVAELRPPEGPAQACEDCLRIGGRWAHLRRPACPSPGRLTPPSAVGVVTST